MQKFTTPNGEVLIVLPEEEYENLVDAADIAAADRVLTDIASGVDELVPSEIVDRLLNGANPVRVWRNHRGMTARELARKTELSAAYISEIETGKKDGSIASMKKIATVLGVDLDDLV